jgi:uncharacterized RDD family membrane protein YckC
VSTSPAPDADAPPGYVSEESKRKFTLVAGILGAAAFLLQFAVPFAAMLALQGYLVGFHGEEPRLNPAQTALWRGELWYVEEPVVEFSNQPRAVLRRVGMDPAEEPEQVVELDHQGFYPLAGDDRLWLVSKKGVSYWSDDRLTRVTGSSPLADFARPFLFEGSPAVLQQRPTGLALLRFGGAAWHEAGRLDILNPEPACGCGLRWAKAAPGNLGLHLVLEFGSTLYYGWWVPGSESDVTWTQAGEAAWGWYPVTLGERPALVVSTVEGNEPYLSIVELGPDGPGEPVRLATDAGGELAVHPLAGSNPQEMIVVMGQAGASRMLAIHTVGDRGVSRRQLSSARSNELDRFPTIMTLMMGIQYAAMLLTPLALAVILSVMMRRHRRNLFAAGDRTAGHASIASRAVAQLVDVVFVAGPLPFGMYFVLTAKHLDELAKSKGFAGFLAWNWPIFLALLWAFVAFIACVFAEGRWGVTPGKVVARIRVLGTDLEPCGFGRALVRNLLKFIDGFFNFLVGIMIVALSENWQRLGDMAARTVVVDSRTSTAG